MVTKVYKKTRQDELQKAVTAAVGAGRELYVESVDFSDPNRPRTCLEVDFPILPINHVSIIEGNAGKPIYQMSKWWARRRSSVFRAMLIAAATKAPDDPAEAAKTVWDAYYGNHQKNPQFRRLKVADIFMGGGTTVVEGARLGMQMYGNDLNPVAWFVVKNELAQVDPQEVKKLLDAIEAEVKPQIMPFYACDCPRGHKGQWKKRSTGTTMDDSFDPLTLTPDERPDYEYAGPEVICTFWAKHGPCQATECNHRTPIMATPVVSVKTLTVKAWLEHTCSKCRKTFDIEQHEARMAPGAILVVAPDEFPFVTMDNKGRYECPHCHHQFQDQKAVVDGKSASLGKLKNKEIDLTLLVHPEWLRGSPGKDASGNWFGGSVTDSAESTAAWNEERAKVLRLIEVRGKLPEQVACPDTGELLFTDQRGGTVPRRSIFACKESTCGREQDVLTAINKYGKTAPVAAYAVQAYCPICAENGMLYGGRFFVAPINPGVLNKACHEWDRERQTSLSSYFPKTPVPPGLETSVRTPLHKYQYKNWSDFFNPRQLLVHTRLLRAIVENDEVSPAARLIALGAFQQYLRTQNMFCIWNIQRDSLEPFLSKNNFQPPARPIENGVFNRFGRGNWGSCAEIAVEGLVWRANPWELVSVENLRTSDARLANQFGTAKSIKAFTGDVVGNHSEVECKTSTALNKIPDESFDLVMTDPPFGDIMQYSELSGFFYSWLRPVMQEFEPELFAAEQPPTALEAVDNAYRHGKDGPTFYSRLLTECWREAFRILKHGGILSFTFHHDQDGPWIAVLESLFRAGFYLEAAYPIRSDETKGEGSKPGTFGAQKVEYDIIHVCRKRTEEPEPISWARLRRQIMRDVRQLQEILEQHQKAGLQETDLRVIRRGKALEYYSHHYGKVYIERGREGEFTVKDALVGINQLLDDESDTTNEAPPVLAEPYTRQFLRLFADRTSLPRDQMQKFLRGPGVSPNEFLERGWCSESQKVFYIIPPVELAQQWKGQPRNGMARDLDQAMFLVGACYENSGIRVQDTLNNPNFSPHPATGDVLDWLGRHGGDEDIKNAARLARQLYNSWQTNNKPKVEHQLSLFGLNESEN